MFAMQFARRLSEYIPRLGHPSLQQHATYFATLYKKYEPLIAKIGTLLSQYCESGVPLDQLRQVVPSFTPHRSAAKAAKKEIGGNPKKKKRNKEKLKALKDAPRATKRTMDPEQVAAALRASLAKDEDFLRLRRGEDAVPNSNDSDSKSAASTAKVEASESQTSESKSKTSASKLEASASKSEASMSKSKASVSKSEASASKSRSASSKSKKDKPKDPKMVITGQGEDDIAKALSSALGLEGEIEIPRWEDLDNPMRKYGLSDEYMEELRLHLSRNRDRKVRYCCII